MNCVLLPTPNPIRRSHIRSYYDRNHTNSSHHPLQSDLCSASAHSRDYKSGSRNNSYTVKGAYIGYEYKKLWINFEYADADGYNGPVGYSVDKKAKGFYSTLAYRITPKVQLLLRYDQFDPNKELANNNKKEYVAGINYFIKGQGLKLVFNYVFCQNQSAKDSHKLILGTQILL